MIEKIMIKDPNDLPVKYWNEVSSLKDFNEIRFSPDLNLIVGPNGSGKSTILKLLKIAFHCSHSYSSCYTRRSIEDNSKINFSLLIENKKISYDGYDIIHDGNPVFAFDSRFEIGGQNNSLDEDFMMEQLTSMLATKNASAGEKILHNVVKVCKHALDVKNIDDKIGIDINDVWDKKLKASKMIIENPTLPKSKKTILFDEPTQNLDMINELDFWQHMMFGTKHFQFIIATHSIGIFRDFACDVNIIELKSGFINEVISKMKVLKYFQGGKND
jgi:ABC-type cobalamin/Fe3+-siderophores transport system ATPase subunit